MSRSQASTIRQEDSQLDLSVRESARPLRLSRELREIPLDRYRLPKDGRKWKSIARERMALAEWLATHGDADGSRIYPAVGTMVRHFGWSRSKTFYLLGDLKELKLLQDSGLLRERGPRVRRMNIPAFTGREPKSKIRTGVQHSGEPKSNHTLDTTVLLTVTKPRKTRAASRPVLSHPCGKSKKLTEPQKRYQRTALLAREAAKAITEDGPMGFPDLKEQIKCVAAAKAIPYDAEMVSNAAEIGARRAEEQKRRLEARGFDVRTPAPTAEELLARHLKGTVPKTLASQTALSSVSSAPDGAACKTFGSGTMR